MPSTRTKRSTQEIIDNIKELNSQIVTLKARIALRRDALMWKTLSYYTNRINMSKDLSEAKMWSKSLIDSALAIDETDDIQELEQELAQYNL